MRACLMVVLLLLASCHGGRPEAPDTADNAQLDEAGNMLDRLADESENGTAP
jgi:hypothetical protein